MTEDPLFVLAVLGAAVWASERLARVRGLRALGSALLVIVLAAVLSNAGVVPTYRAGDALYDGIFGVVAPLGVFWLLLGVRLRALRRAGPTMLLLFFVGAFATAVGVPAAYHLVDLPAAVGDDAPALAGMFVGTYTGGSVNFSALAVAFGIQERGALFAGATAVDALMTTVWMVVTLIVPRRMAGPGREAAETDAPDAAAAPVDPDLESVSPRDAAALVALALLALVVSRALPETVPGQWMIVLTTLALVLAQVDAVHRLRGARVLGMTAILLFLAVIGVLCDLEALAGLGPLGGTLFGFVAVALAVHGVLLFGVTRLLRRDPAAAAVCSQANVGGGTTALARARALDRDDLVLPAILVGSIGTAVGTHLGLAVALVLGAG
ncbi:MAG: DUF819 domain-containing protein [Planctomycetota bacterium JB042]